MPTVSHPSANYYFFIDSTDAGNLRLREARFYYQGVQVMPVGVAGYGGGTMSNLIDGDDATVWEADSYYGGVQFAFASPVLIDDIKIVPGGSAGNTPEGWSICIDDGAGGYEAIQTLTSDHLNWSVGVARDFPFTVTFTPTLTVTRTGLPGGHVGDSPSEQYTATGGTGPYTYSITSGALPAGRSMNASTGAVTGAYTADGTFSYTVHAVDSTSGTPLVGDGTSGSYQVADVSVPMLTLSGPGTGTVGTATSNFTVGISGGSWPSGLTVQPDKDAGTSGQQGTWSPSSLSAPGTFTHTPDAAGSYNISLIRSDTSLATAPTPLDFTASASSGGGGGGDITVVIPELPTDPTVVKFCDMPTANTWASVVPSGSMAGRLQDPWTDYSAGCTFCPGVFSDAGAFVRGPASGHHVSGLNFSASAVLQMSDTAGQHLWMCKNRPPSDILFADVEGTDVHTDDTGTPGNGDHGFLADGQQHGFYLPNYAGAPHTYNTPIWWNGALHFLGFGGIPIRRDITQDHGGDTQLIDLTVADGPENNLCVWKDASGVEQGFFTSSSVNAGFYGCTLLFKVETPGYDLSYPQIGGPSFTGCGMWIDDANQLMCGLHQDGTLLIVDLETKLRTQVAITLPSGTVPIKLSPKWLRSRDCALGYDAANGNFVSFIPPTSGDRRTTNWTCQVMTSALSDNAPDGSLSALQTSDNPSVSVYAGWDYNPRLDAGMLSPKHDGPIQLVRFASTIGPNSSAPDTPTVQTAGDAGIVLTGDGQLGVLIQGVVLRAPGVLDVPLF